MKLTFGVMGSSGALAKLLLEKEVVDRAALDRLLREPKRVGAILVICEGVRLRDE